MATESKRRGERCIHHVVLILALPKQVADLWQQAVWLVQRDKQSVDGACPPALKLGCGAAPIAPFVDQHRQGNWSPGAGNGIFGNLDRVVVAVHVDFIGVLGGTADQAARCASPNHHANRRWRRGAATGPPQMNVGACEIDLLARPDLPKCRDRLGQFGHPRWCVRVGRQAPGRFLGRVIASTNT